MIERAYIYTEYQPTLEDLKRHLRITSDDLDETLKPYLLAGVNAAENSIGSIIAMSEFMDRRRFTSAVRLEGPVVEVISVSLDGVEVAEEDYMLDGRMLTISEELRGDSLTLTYKAGMPQVPFDIKAAVMMIAAKLFNNPADSVEQLPSAAKNMLRPYRSWGIHDGE